MINKIILGHLILVTSVIADDYTSQRGMTNLLGIDTNLRCSQQMLSLIHI